jgi:hypothetical protein
MRRRGLFINLEVFRKTELLLRAKPTTMNHFARRRGAEAYAMRLLFKRRPPVLNLPFSKQHRLLPWLAA